MSQVNQCTKLPIVLEFRELGARGRKKVKRGLSVGTSSKIRERKNLPKLKQEVQIKITQISTNQIASDTWRTKNQSINNLKRPYHLSEIAPRKASLSLNLIITSIPTKKIFSALIDFFMKGINKIWIGIFKKRELRS